MSGRRTRGIYTFEVQAIDQNLSYSNDVARVQVDVHLPYGQIALWTALVLALYVDSNDVKELYQVPAALWLACPIMLYWIYRVWLLAGRGRLSPHHAMHGIFN